MHSTLEKESNKLDPEFCQRVAQSRPVSIERPTGSITDFLKP